MESRWVGARQMDEAVRRGVGLVQAPVSQRRAGKVQGFRIDKYGILGTAWSSGALPLGVSHATANERGSWRAEVRIPSQSGCRRVAKTERWRFLTFQEQVYIVVQRIAGVEFYEHPDAGGPGSAGKQAPEVLETDRSHFEPKLARFVVDRRSDDGVDAKPSRAELGAVR